MKGPNDISVRGRVTIKQGEEIIQERICNHFVDDLLASIISVLIGGHIEGSRYDTHVFELLAHDWMMYLGTDTATPTTRSMVQLVNPIGVAPGTGQDFKSIAETDGSSTGNWAITYEATWLAGNISGTVGEMGLYLTMVDTTSALWRNLGGEVLSMASRLSHADGNFTAFLIDETKPLTIDWTVEMNFTYSPT